MTTGFLVMTSSRDSALTCDGIHSQWVCVAGPTNGIGTALGTERVAGGRDDVVAQTSKSTGRPQRRARLKMPEPYMPIERPAVCEACATLLRGVIALEFDLDMGVVIFGFLTHSKGIDVVGQLYEYGMFELFPKLEINVEDLAESGVGPCRG